MRTRHIQGRDKVRAVVHTRKGQIVARGMRVALAVLAIQAFALAGCTGAGTGVGSSRVTPVVTAEQAIGLHSDSIMAIAGVVGLYEGRTEKGETVIRVMLAERSRTIERQLPRKLEGYRVEVEETGTIDPMAK